MSHSIADKLPETSPVKTTSIPAAEDSQSVIDGEIVDNQSQASATPYDNCSQVDQESDHGGSLVYQSSSEESVNLEEIATYSLVEKDFPGDLDNYPSPIWQDCLENVLTPWGMTSILLLLFGNILLSWAQFSPSRPLMAVENTKKMATLPVKEFPTLIPSQPKSLSVNSLSSLPLTSLTVTVAKPSLLPKFAPSQASKLPNNAIKTIKTPPHPSLTTALLPPSLRPQLVQHPVSPPTIPVRMPPVKFSPVSPPATVTQSIPFPPVIKPSAQLPPSPSSENPEKAKATQDLIRQQMVDNMQRQETTPSLGFNQETRLKMQAIQNQTDLNSATEQLQQLQQQYPANREEGIGNKE